MGFEGDCVASKDSGGGGRREMCWSMKRTMGPGEFGEVGGRSAIAENRFKQLERMARLQRKVLMRIPILYSLGPPR